MTTLIIGFTLAHVLTWVYILTLHRRIDKLSPATDAAPVSASKGWNDLRAEIRGNHG